MIRSFKLDDGEFIINSHYDIYSKEYNFDLSFKDFIAKIIDDFIKRSDYLNEHIWILEIDDEPRGSIGITKVNESVAQLRLFLVDPSLRGSGQGGQLVQKVIDFCRENEYKTIILWTNSELKAARHLYEKFGFRIMETRKEILSNLELVEERWELSIN